MIVLAFEYVLSLGSSTSSTAKRCHLWQKNLTWANVKSFLHLCACCSFYRRLECTADLIIPENQNRWFQLLFQKVLVLLNLKAGHGIFRIHLTTLFMTRCKHAGPLVFGSWLETIQQRNSLKTFLHYYLHKYVKTSCPQSAHFFSWK